MNLVLGSTSPHKKDILQKALEGKLAYWGIEGVEVESGISDQPVSIEETIEGATNRAKNALAQQPHAGLAVGMEGGLEPIGGIYNLVCAVAFWDGERLIVGQSGHLPLPHGVSDKIKLGGKFSELIREYQKTAPPEEQERIAQLISRELSFTSAINDALPRLNQRYSRQKLDVLYVLMSPKLGWQLYFKLAAWTAATYFILKAFICLTVVILGYMYMLMPFPYQEFYDALDYLILISIGCWIVGLWGLSSSGLFRNVPKEQRDLHISIFGVAPLLLVNAIVLWAAWAQQHYIQPIIFRAFSDVTYLFVLLIAIFCLYMAWRLLRQLLKLSLVSQSTVRFLMIGLVLYILNWLITIIFYNPNIYLMPWFLLGYFLIRGLLNMTSELGLASVPTKGVSAFQGFDRI